MILSPDSEIFDYFIIGIITVVHAIISLFLSGDNWVVVCSTQQWRRNDAIRLKHVVSEK